MAGKKTALLAVAAACLAVSAAHAGSAADGAQAIVGHLKAGASRVAITPSPDEFPYVVQGELPFVGVHDPVFTRALVLDDGERRVVLVSLEVTAVPQASELVKAVAQAAGVPEANVLIAASHTHSVPLVFFHGGAPNPVQVKEIDRIRLSVIDATREATSHLQPATVAFSRGEGWVNVNNGEAAGLKKSFDPSGPSDRSLDVVRLQTPKGETLALLVNYASHGEVMFRSVTKDGGYEVTGDLPGETARLLEDNPRGAPVVLYTAAAEADQLPLFKSLQVAGNVPGVDEGAAGWGLLDVQARRLANSVIDVLANMPPGASDARLFAASSSATCPGQHWKRDPASGQMSLEERPPVSIPLSVIRIGDIALAGVGGDLGSVIGQHIKASSPAPHTTVISMTAGAVGYIFPDASYRHPGHGLYGSPLKAGCAEDAIVDGFKPMLSPR